MRTQSFTTTRGVILVNFQKTGTSSSRAHRISRCVCTTLRILTIGNTTKLLYTHTANGPLPMLLLVRTISGWRTVRYEVLFALLPQIPALAVNHFFSIFQIWADVGLGEVEALMGESAILA